MEYLIDQVSKSTFWYNFLRRIINGGTFREDITRFLDCKLELFFEKISIIKELAGSLLIGVRK